MQKVVTIRASQKDLDETLARFSRKNWRVVSVTRGSEWGRIGLSYKWTIILECNENDANASSEIESIKKDAATKSYCKAALLVVGLLVGIGILAGIFYAILFSTI